MDRRRIEQARPPERQAEGRTRGRPAQPDDNRAGEPVDSRTTGGEPRNQMLERASIQHGMPVRGRSGQRLGRVLECFETHLVVQKWPWSRRHDSIAWEEVAGLAGGLVHLRHGREALRRCPPANDGPSLRVLPLNPEASSVADSVRSAFEAR